MKSKIALICLIIILFSCKKDEPAVVAEKTENEKANEWIYNTMKHHYLFYKDIPATTSLDFKKDPEVFFPLLLSPQEKGSRSYYFSYIEKKDALKVSETKDQYGFEYYIYDLGNSSFPYVIRIAYVMPGSPADKSGIKRGDWYYSVNGQLINENIYEQLISGSAKTLGKCTLSLISKNIYVTPTSSVNLQASTSYIENPILLDSVYISSDNQKIGYLIYNSFSTGPNGFDDKQYETELKNCISQFKSQNVQKLILDLRYNGGGYLSTCKLLTSIILPATNLGKLMAIEEYNDILTKEYSAEDPEYNKMYFHTKSEVETYNLNLTSLTVITSSWTASASELVINSLRPYMTVTQLGTTTVGKNMGSYEITSETYSYSLHPITIKIFNSANESNYSNGFTPATENIFDETKMIDNFYPLGDSREWLLNKAFTTIGVTSFKSAVVSSGLDIFSNISSSFNKKNKGLILK